MDYGRFVSLEELKDNTVSLNVNDQKIWMQWFINKKQQRNAYSYFKFNIRLNESNSIFLKIRNLI